MAQASKRTTYYVVQAFSRGKKDGVEIDRPLEARSADHAKRLGERMAATKLGVVAFSRTGDPALGEFDPPVILLRHGEIPYDLEELVPT